MDKYICLKAFLSVSGRAFVPQTVISQSEYDSDLTNEEKNYFDELREDIDEDDRRRFESIGYY